MSYARFGCEGSDVYVYRDATHLGYVCCACRLRRLARDFITATPQQMVLHLIAHEAAGHSVPPSTIDQLAAEHRR